MKKIGMIGGLAWPSTADYYRLLCEKTNAHFREQGASLPYPTPHMVIESLNIAEMRGLRGREGDDASWQRYEGVFRATFMRLKESGAQLGIIASNTPHMRWRGITAGLDLPVVSILDATAAAVQAAGGRRALILGTPVTMKSSAYPETLRAQGIEALPRLSDGEMERLEKLIDDDLYQGDVGGAREEILALCAKRVSDGASDIVCLACTELPLAFPEHRDAAGFAHDGIRFVNTTVAHVEATLREALA